MNPRLLQHYSYISETYMNSLWNWPVVVLENSTNILPYLLYK